MQLVDFYFQNKENQKHPPEKMGNTNATESIGRVPSFFRNPLNKKHPENNEENTQEDKEYLQKRIDIQHARHVLRDMIEAFSMRIIFETKSELRRY